MVGQRKAEPELKGAHGWSWAMGRERVRRSQVRLLRAMKVYEWPRGL